MIRQEHLGLRCSFLFLYYLRRGFDSGNTRPEALGIKLIELLANQLNGTASVRSGDGTVCTIVIPVSNLTEKIRKPF